MNAALVDTAVQALSPLVRVSSLNVSFGSAHALREVELSIGAGELVAVTGEPGAGKTTLVRCLAGDLAPSTGEVLLDGRPLPADPAGADRRGIAVVWQDAALCDNLDVAGNLLLGRETRRLMFSESRFHAAAASVLETLRVPIKDTTQLVGSLPGGQRQLLAIAKAVSRSPQMLLLDEPTASLGVLETSQVEDLLRSLRDRGIAILLVSRDIEQLFRVADRIVVLRHGRAIADLDPRVTHPDDVGALVSGQQVDSSARRQLTRLHGLADRLVSADPSSSLSLILSALASALSAEKVCIHVVSGRSLVRAASLGLTPGQVASWARLPFGPAGGPAGQAAALEQRVLEPDLRGSDAWATFCVAWDSPEIASAWSVPVMGPAGLSAVITVFKAEPRVPGRDELDLLTLYAGWSASAVERDRLLDQVTARNRVLETIREMLETLTGPVTVADGFAIALQSLRRGLQADEVGLLTRLGAEQASWRAYAGPIGSDPATMSTHLREAAEEALDDPRRDGSGRQSGGGRGKRVLAVPFLAPTGAAVLLAAWNDVTVTEAETNLMEDAAHSLRLALEREQAALAHQEAAALRRSRELQRGFLSRLSHELRTPLTAIRGYASSLLQPDVTWDGDSERRFLDRIAAESARLGRLVDDLLDFSAIESGVMRLQRDWCDLRLVVEAAVSCLPAEWSSAVSIACDDGLPTVWGDHDRLEQVFVNLLGNALRHNPPGTHVLVTAEELASMGSVERDTPGGESWAAGEVQISVIDDGAGFPPQLAPAPFESARRHPSKSSGAGLGLSIARGIVEAHGGHIELRPAPTGTRFDIRLPIEAGTRLTSGEGHDRAEVDALAAMLSGTMTVERAIGSGDDA